MNGQPDPGDAAVAALAAEFQRRSVPLPEMPAGPVFRFRAGDQPLPVPNDGPSMHDLVSIDLCTVCTVPGPANAGVVRDLAARKQLGLDRYGSLLQAGNGRDALRDLYEELQDGAVYARQWIAENEDGDGSERHVIWSVYQGLLGSLLQVWALMDSRSQS